MIIYELSPIYDARESFYGKAKVFSYDGGLKLGSYAPIIRLSPLSTAIKQPFMAHIPKRLYAISKSF